MSDYYDAFLSAARLQLVYKIAPPRVQQYLDAELAFVLDRINPSDAVIELGCGYGRVMKQLKSKAKAVMGIDLSLGSLKFGAAKLMTVPRICLAQMNALSLGFQNRSFNKVVCIQNGISAFHVDPLSLIREAARITRPGGSLIFSSYCDKFWECRLDWFRAQAEHGLIGEIDWEATGDGEIVCTDGFHATTFWPYEFAKLAVTAGLRYRVTEVDDSSVFCEMFV
jgi:SAM-dependent methyltransferase